MDNTKIEHFIYFQNTTTNDVRYFNIGFQNDKGFCGFGCDFVGGGEFQEFICVDGEVVIDEDCGDWDVELGRLEERIGTKALATLEDQKELFFDWNDSFQPVLSNEVMGGVSIREFDDTEHKLMVSTSDNIIVVDFGNTYAENLQAFVNDSGS